MEVGLASRSFSVYTPCISISLVSFADYDVSRRNVIIFNMTKLA